MLANLPPKRITRKIICLKEGFKTTRSKQTKTKTKQSKFKCGKLIRGKGKEQNKSNNIAKYKRTNENKKDNYRRSLRCLNKVLTSRILDTNSSLIVRRKYKKKINNHKKKEANKKDVFFNKSHKEPLTQTIRKTVKTDSTKMCVNNENEVKEEVKSKRSSPRIEKRSEYNCLHKTLMDKMNIKRFFPVKKNTKNAQNKTTDENKQDLKPKNAKINCSASKGKQVMKDDTEKTDENSYCAIKDNLCLRKRKLKSENTENLLPHKTRQKKNGPPAKNCEISKRRKQKNCQKIVAEEHVTANSDSSAITQQENKANEENIQVSSKNLEEPSPILLKIVEETEPVINLEEKKVEERAKSASPIKCEINSEEQQCTKNLTIVPNNSITVSTPSERLKKKIKRPSRGLNDCIAMLTSKLEKSIEDSSIENGSSHVSQENTTTSLNSEYVLKVPLFNEHFQLYSKKEQNEVLDILNDSEEANKLNVPKQNNETLVTQTVENIDADSRAPDYNNHTNIVTQEIVSEIESLHDTEKQASLRKSDISLKQKDQKPENKELSNYNMPKENNNLTHSSKASNEVKTSLHKKRKQKTQKSQTAIDKNSIQKRKLRKIEKEEKEEEEEPMNLTSQEEKCLQETVTLDEHHCTLFKEPEPVFDNRQMEIEECKIPSVEVGRKIDTDSEDEIPLSALVKDNRWHSEKSEDTQNYFSVQEIQNELKESTAINDSIEKNTQDEKIEMSNSSTTFEHEDVTLEIDCENMKDKLLETEEPTNFSQLDNEKHGSYASENKPDKMSVEANVHGLKEWKNSVEIRKNRFDVSISFTYVQNCTLVEETIDQNFERQNNENEIEIKDNCTSSIVDSVGELLLTQECNIALPYSKQNEELPETFHDSGVEEKRIAEKSSVSQTDISESKYQKTSTDGLSSDYSILGNENKVIFNNEDIVIRRASSNSNESLTEVSNSKEVNCNFQHTKVYHTSETDATERIIQKEKENDESHVVAENNFSELIKSSNVEKVLISSDAPSSVQTEKSRDNVFTETLEDKVDHKLASNHEDSLRDDTISNNSSTCNNLVNDGDKDKEVKELRRSKRNSKRIASYNEIDLVDPLLDEIDGNISDIIKDTTQAFYVNKTKNRKKNKADPKVTKPSGEELFHLLKSTTNENILPKPPANSFLHHFDDISNDFNDDNFDILGDILEKSMAVIEKDLTEKTILNVTTDALEISENNSNEVITNSNVKTQFSFKNRNVANKSKGKKKSKKNSKHQQKMLGKEIENRLANQQEVSENMTMEFLEKNGMEDSNKTVEIDSNKKSDTDKNKAHYCEICDKFFCRLEGLTKHKRTLTHISKLSEIEAREASLKSKDSQLKDREPETDEIISEAKKDLSLLNILKTVDTNEGKTGSPRYTMNIGDSHIKLTDIINDVLNKPVLKNTCPENTFSNILTQNDTPSEVKRYRSLAERKSFESDHCPDITKGDSNMKTIDCFEPEITNAAGTILERQISLLENIIENRSALSYIDELSISSTQSLNENTSVDGELIKYRNQNASVPTFCKQNDVKLSSKEEEFLRPSQYEEISEDSIHRNSEEQRSRKILNRDEELFLECCSLLKSGSEVSSYSKNSARISKDFSNLVEEKRFNRVEVLEPSSLSRKEDSSSDNSIVTTTLDDNFSPDESNSVTISSDWNVKHASTAVKNTDFKTKDFTFEKMFNSSILPEERLPTVDDATSEDFTAQLNVTGDQVENGSNISSPETSGNCFDGKSSEEFNNILNIENRKILTKGAMKEFEGLKVSIPTEDLNMAKILTSNPPVKMHLSDNNEDYSEKNEARFISSSTTSRSESRSTSKTKKKHSPKPPQTKKISTLTKTSKIHDIYDFEETQDNSDIFTKPNFRSFRSSSEKSKRIDLFEESDNESADYVDTVSFDAFSSSTSSVSEMVPRKSKTQQNITKKKCMIMGRIFKNAAKSRSIDENIRNIPVIDNSKLVEDFVLSCPEPSLNNTEVKPTMTEEEMNAAFDSLLNSGNIPAKPINSEVLSNEKSASKNSCNKKKSKSKNRKRSYWHSDSSDDEFKLQTSSSKRVKKKNNTTSDSCINLEQELKECIGVASRKSQRKCTSGKQNVLIEYWSSDESLFEPAQEYPSLKPAVDNELTKVKTSEIMYEKISVKDVTNKERSVNQELKKSTSNSSCNSNRRKRAAVNPLYHWSSSSEDESHDLIEIKPVRDEFEDDDERPVQHGWIVGDSPKKLVTMLAQAKGKKCETEGVKEHGKKRTNALS